MLNIKKEVLILCVVEAIVEHHQKGFAEKRENVLILCVVEAIVELEATEEIAVGASCLNPLCGGGYC